MATHLHKPIHREVTLLGVKSGSWVFTLAPPDDTHRFPRLLVREKKRRASSAYWVPLESVVYYAADKWRQMKDREKRQRRKLAKEAKQKGECS